MVVITDDNKEEYAGLDGDEEEEEEEEEEKRGRTGKCKKKEKVKVLSIQYHTLIYTHGSQLIPS